MSVEINQEIAQELITFKLEHLSKIINETLEKWNETNADEFIDKARNGILKNAEMDAISIRQILADYKRLKELLTSILVR
ncbi:hypothetical protein [Candidatus Lokiarchaeum ossiferum]|uniref:hypothetical protein n=1 Tax=Candidatus Lokiarchaeum ossiferum TaxID=2951803 RepID=UPI00352D462E